MLLASAFELQKGDNSEDAGDVLVGKVSAKYRSRPQEAGRTQAVGLASFDSLGV
jgi:hypothetical protein